LFFCLITRLCKYGQKILRRRNWREHNAYICQANLPIVLAAYKTASRWDGVQQSNSITHHNMRTTTTTTTTTSSSSSSKSHRKKVYMTNLRYSVKRKVRVNRNSTSTSKSKNKSRRKNRSSRRVNSRRINRLLNRRNRG